MMSVSGFGYIFKIIVVVEFVSWALGNAWQCMEHKDESA